MTYRERREAAGLSRRTLSAEIGVTERTLQRWESGESTPHPTMAEAWDAALQRYEREAS